MSFFMSSRRILTTALAVASSLLVVLPAGASNITGFLPQAGEGSFAVSYADESYDEFWRGEEKRPTPPALGEISTTSFSLWMNWGLTDRLALVADIAHVDAQADGTSGMSDDGLQDASILLVSRLARFGHGSVEHSWVGAVGLRTPIESYVANAPVARGDDTTDGLARLVYLLRAGRFYWSQQVGFDFRGGDAPDGFPIYSEVGYDFGRFTGIGFYSLYLADGGTDIGDPGFTFPSNQEEYERIGAKLIVDLNGPWSVFAGGFTTLDGRNVGNADGLFFGAIVNF